MSQCIYFKPGYRKEQIECTDYCEKKDEHLPCCADCKKGKYTVELSWKKLDRLIQILEASPYGCDLKILNKIGKVLP